MVYVNIWYVCMFMSGQLCNIVSNYIRKCIMHNFPRPISTTLYLGTTLSLLLMEDPSAIFTCCRIGSSIIHGGSAMQQVVPELAHDSWASLQSKEISCQVSEINSRNRNTTDWGDQRDTAILEPKVVQRLMQSSLETPLERTAAGCKLQHLLQASSNTLQIRGFPRPVGQIKSDSR